MTRPRALDERYPIDITNPLLALGACEKRLGEIARELESIKTASVVVGELVEIVKQQHACAVLIRKAHEGGRQ